ncbi:MAG: hypothetical protein NTX50_09305 [Candidatus Sumerlaeota bacterium]|nr:hypothetical protein [Candidatus Sumerlaeota bacterium]
MSCRLRMMNCGFGVAGRRRFRACGFGLVAMMGLIALCAIGCAALLMRSMDIYHASAMGQWRLQAQAAAEGAAVLCRQAPEKKRDEIKIGDCVVRFKQAQSTQDKAAETQDKEKTDVAPTGTQAGTQVGTRAGTQGGTLAGKPVAHSIILEVETHSKADQMVYAARYIASYRRTPEGKWTLDQLEKTP